MRRVACIALPALLAEIGPGEQAVRAALVRVAESMLAFGPTVGFDGADGVVWVEVGGCAHLHGGEPELARAIGACVFAQGHACRVAIAGGPRIAAAVARFAPKGKARSGGPFVVPEGKGAAAMRVLPVDALGFDDDTRRWLSGLGLRTCGDLQKLPRRALGTRLGARAHDVMQLLDGEDRAPLVAWRPAEVPEERIDLEWGAPSTEALAFVMTTLCERLSARLEGRAMAAGRLEIVLGLDRALCGAAPPTSRLEIVLAAPMARAKELFAVARARLERHVLAAPVLTATLRASELAPAAARTRDLLSPEPKAERALLPLVAELAAELGAERVGTLAIVDTWVPSERSRLVPPHPPPPLRWRRGGGDGKRSAPLSASGEGLGGEVTSRSLSTLVNSALEPSRIVHPISLAREVLVDPVLLARVEAVEWWRRGAFGCDLVAAWFSDALAWVEIGDRVELRGWID